MNSARTLSAVVTATIPLLLAAANADTLCINSGSMGLDGDATDTSLVTLFKPGAIAAGGDFSTEYGIDGNQNGAYSRLSHKAVLNTAAPFSIEFWAYPYSSDNDDAPVDNRIAVGDRSGWAFFQRAAGTGWNFRMYNGVGSQMAFNLTGGTSTLFAWSHVVATWDGSVAKLYVNGVATNALNDIPAGQSTTYNPSTTATLTLGALGDNSSPYRGQVDEVAFYSTELSPAQIAAHYSTASSPVAGAYSALVQNDGALVYYQQNDANVAIANQGADKVVSFRGILSQSADLSEESWTDLEVTSPYTVTPGPGTPRLFFRARR
ncbi:LamG domain-containing protein [Luteolibacter marinus]|uniref:LamG domain-containing protein n=1 Tax=Luteolibacter marinus TaxID=2776705 RepID=UPI0018685155|nr:LamG domain-containing protein [Luteolibacter marinus]